MLSTPQAKFFEAATKALSTSQGFDFERDVFLKRSEGCWKKREESQMLDEAYKELVKKVIKSKVGSAGLGASEAGSSTKSLEIFV